MEDDFRFELECLINRFSKENYSDTPDYILADYLIECLNNWNKIVRKRDKWHGFKPWEEKK